MGATTCSFAEQKLIPFSSGNFQRGGRQRIRGFVPHVQVGDGPLGPFFSRPKPPGERASADFWCSKKGRLEQYVSLADQSFAQGSKLHNGNPYMISCEFEGMPDEPMTDAQLDTGGRLVAWSLTDVNEWELRVNMIPGAEGITPHFVFGGGHTCPQGPGGVGPRLGQFPDLVLSTQRWLGLVPPPPPPINLKEFPVDVIFRIGPNGAGYQVDTRSGFVMPVSQAGADALRAKGLPDVEIAADQGDDLLRVCQDLRTGGH